MSYNASNLTNVYTRTASDTAAIFYYANWDDDDLTSVGYITSAAAKGVQQYDLTYAINPMTGNPKWYIVKEVVSDVPALQLVGAARDIAYVDLAVLGTDISSVAKWYAQAFQASGPAGPTGPQGPQGVQGNDGAPAPTPTINTPVTRSLNSAFTISSTRPSVVTYTVALEVTNPLLAGNSTAEAYLEYSSNGTTWVTVSNGLSRSSVALTVTVTLTDRKEAIISGYIPANYQVRLRTATSGTASVSYIRGQEAIL